jgi:threonine synthase
MAGTGVAVDPHTAVAVHAGRACRGTRATPLLILATAHPAKFPDAVEAATGERPALPPRLAGLMEREERYEVLPNDIATVQAFIRARA